MSTDPAYDAWTNYQNREAERFIDQIIAKRELEKIKGENDALREALKLCLELASNALDHAHPRNSASISAIAKTAQYAIKETQ